MKRTKEWWGRLTKEERSRLVVMERDDTITSGSCYYPEGVTECYCGNLTTTSGLCNKCLDEYIRLIRKADNVN